MPDGMFEPLTPEEQTHTAGPATDSEDANNSGAARRATNAVPAP
jgi:hypothetical protein